MYVLGSLRSSILADVLASPGKLLRAWRTELGWTQHDVAEVVHASVATVSSWETDTRRIPLGSLERLDAEFGAGGCLVDLVRAIGTPSGFWTYDGDQNLVPQPRRYWGHVFPGPPGPVWAWVRPAHGSWLSACCHMGAAGLRIEAETGPEGAFFDSWYSSPHWLHHVVLTNPGWVDFGRGVPPAWLGRPVKTTACLRDLEIVNPRDLQVGFFAEELRRRDRGDPATLRERLRELAGPQRWDALEAQLRTARPAPELAGSIWTQSDPRPPETPGQRRVLHRRLRRARGLSLADTAEAVTRLLPDGARPVTLGQVHNYESGRTSRVRYLPALLDTVYGAFGWSSCERVPVEPTGPGSVQALFPDFWTGPVSVTAIPAARAALSGTITFIQRAWKLDRDLPAGPTSFWFCRVADETPLRVQVPPGWIVQARIGQAIDAIDANRDWLPVDEAAADEIFTTVVHAWLHYLGKTPADLDQALAPTEVASAGSAARLRSGA